MTASHDELVHQLEVRLKELEGLLLSLRTGGFIQAHEDGCLEDDSCTCPVAQMLREALEEG